MVMFLSAWYWISLIKLRAEKLGITMESHMKIITPVLHKSSPDENMTESI